MKVNKHGTRRKSYSTAWVVYSCLGVHIATYCLKKGDEKAMEIQFTLAAAIPPNSNDRSMFGKYTWILEAKV